MSAPAAPHSSQLVRSVTPDCDCLLSLSRPTLPPDLLHSAPSHQTEDAEPRPGDSVLPLSLSLANILTGGFGRKTHRKTMNGKNFLSTSLHPVCNVSVSAILPFTVQWSLI